MKNDCMKIAKWIPAAIIFCTNWYLSNQERVACMPSFWNADKLVHLVCFAGLSFWVAFACGVKSKKQLLLPAAIVSAYGIIDEIHQYFTPGRNFSLLDWCADITGAVLGACVYAGVAKLLGAVRKKV